jgi:hypothetical protein
MNRDIIDRIRAILKDVTNRKIAVPYCERPVDFLSASQFLAFRTLAAEEFELAESFLFDDEGLTFQELIELIEDELSRL